MKPYEYSENNIDKYNRWSILIADCINSFGRKNHLKMGEEIGVKGFVFLDILQRITFNLHGLSALLTEFKYSQDYRFSINLIFRGILSDILTGLYLAHFSHDLASFENEVKVLDIDFAKFAKFVIENEVLLTKQISKDESDVFISNFKSEFIKENSELFKDVETWSLKSPIDIRNTSDKSLFLDDAHLKNSLTDAIKDKVIGHNTGLKHLQLTFVLYRYFSQYHHYSLKGRSTFYLPIEYDMRRYYASFLMINESVHIFCKLIGADHDDLELLKLVNNELMIKK